MKSVQSGLVNETKESRRLNIATNKDACFTTGKDDYGTPWDFFNELDAEFHFTLDACATANNAKCKRFYSPEQDGKAQNWQGETVFCNPPYSDSQSDPNRQSEWIRKCHEESKKPNTTIVALIPARTDTKRFHKYILGKAEIRFLEGRLKFIGGDGSAPFPSMVVIWKSS